MGYSIGKHHYNGQQETVVSPREWKEVPHEARKWQEYDELVLSTSLLDPVSGIFILLVYILHVFIMANALSNSLTSVQHGSLQWSHGGRPLLCA